MSGFFGNFCYVNFVAGGKNFFTFGSIKNASNMEVILYIIIAIGLLVIIMRFNKCRVPEPIKQDFKRKFPQAKNCDWSHPKDFYEVIFYSGGGEKKVKYDDSGYWIETKSMLFKKDLPGHVIKMCDEKFEEYTLDDISLVSNNRGQKFYKLVVDAGDVNYLVKVDENGGILQLRDLTSDKLSTPFEDKEPL